MYKCIYRDKHAYNTSLSNDLYYHSSILFMFWDILWLHFLTANNPKSIYPVSLPITAQKYTFLFILVNLSATFNTFRNSFTLKQTFYSDIIQRVPLPWSNNTITLLPVTRFENTTKEHTT